MDIVIKSCRICGQKSSFNDLLFKTNGGYNLVECTYCKTFMVDSRPTPEELQRSYDSLFKDGGYEQHRAEHRALLAGSPIKRPYQTKILRTIEGIAPGKTLVEIGGGTGAFGVIASKRGWRYCDYDVSQVAVDFVRRLGLYAEHFNESDFPPLSSKTTDVIVMWEVLEHIWPVHEYLLKLRDALRPNGLIAISTPNLNRKGYIASLSKPGLGSPPIHLNFFTQASLDVTLRMAGFNRIKFTNRRFYRPQPNFQSVIRHIKIALGREETKTLYAIAQ